MQFTVEQTENYRELARLNEAVQAWHHDNYSEEFKPFDIYAAERAFGKMIQDDNGFAFLARHQQKSVGYLLGFIKTRPESAFQYEKAILYIDQIASISEYQHRGVGQLLINKAFELARIKQLSEVQLDFRSGNKQAERFFLKNGFEYYKHSLKKLLK